MRRPHMPAAFQVLFLGRLWKAFSGGGTVSVQEARRIMDEESDVVVIDVRQSGEFKGGHIPGAKHIPVGMIPARAERLDPDRTYLMYCRSGARSGRAARILSSRGFKRVHNVRGGLPAWKGAGFPVDRK